MVFEFHNLHQLFNQAFFEIASRVFYKLLNTHSCVHIHPNNTSHVMDAGRIKIPPGMEFTFYRKDSIKSSSKALEFPNKLDSDNTDKKHIKLTS